MLIQAPPPPPLLLPGPPVATPQPGFIPAMPQVYHPVPFQAQTAAGYMPPGAYAHQPAGYGHSFVGAHPLHRPEAHHSTAGTYHSPPRHPSLGQRILRALRMPTGRASTVASSRSPSRDRGRSKRRRSSPESRRSSRPRSSRDTRRSSRPRSTRSTRGRAPASPPPRQLSPGSTQATVQSDDYVPSQGNRRGHHHRNVEDDVSSLSSDEGEVPAAEQDIQSNAAVRQTSDVPRLVPERRNEETPNRR